MPCAHRRANNSTPFAFDDTSILIIPPPRSAAASCTTGTDRRFTEKGGSAFRTKIGLGMFRGLVRHCEEGGASKYCNRIETAEFRKSGPPDAPKFESHPRAAAAAAGLAATETPSAAPGTPKVPGIYMGSTRSSTGASAPGPRVSRGSSHNNAAACQTPGLRGYQVPEDSE